MEQRLLRLGDIVDDYCPRERRITNHAIVAVVENAICQTRCTTCDHEHEFKQAREPRRRLTKKADDALYRAVLAGTGPPLVAREAAGEAEAPRVEPSPVPSAAPSEPVEAGPSSQDDAWPVHRTLIRA